MINLIPPHGHTALRHEYVLRVITMYAFIFCGILLASTALMAPTYILTGAQLKAVRSDNPDMEHIRASFEAASDEIKIANAIMGQLRFNETDRTYSKVIEEIVRSADSGIVFMNFQASHTEGALTEIVVQGTAKSRNTLASFKTVLEESPLFEKAVIPIADLARDTNLPFAVTITLSAPTP